MTDEELKEIKRINAARTQGPWYWEPPQKGCSVRLYTPKNGYCIVMDFVRRGSQGAQPRFSDRGNQPLGGILHKADEIDILTNPDAVFIARASTMVPSLIREVDRLKDKLAVYEDPANWTDHDADNIGWMMFSGRKPS